MSETSPDFFKILRAVRFVFVVIILGLSYFSIRFSFSLHSYEELWAGMGLKLLPITSFVIAARPVLMAFSFLFPIAALVSCWDRNFARSFYIIGILTLLTIVQLILLYQGWLAPLVQLMSNVSTPN